MFCSISGAPARVPVLSPRSHRVFERKLLEEYIIDNNVDPISNEPLSIEEIIPIQLDAVNEIGLSSLRSSNSANNSIPSLLSSLQQEWDALALEVFQLRKQLLESKQELSLALYKHDAAVRVAAKAVKERDEARVALQQLAISIGNGGDDDDDDDDDDNEIKEEQEEQGILPPTNDEDFSIYSEKISESQAKLFQLHKSTKYPVPFQPTDEIKLDNSFELQNNIQDISSYKIKVSSDGSRLIAINNETFTTALVFDILLNELKSVKELTYKSPITSYHITKNEFFVVLETGEIYINEEEIFQLVIDDVQTNKITQILVHPDTDLNLLILIKSNGSYLILDSLERKIVYESSPFSNNVTTASIHPDGNLIALGGGGESDSNNIYIYEISQGNLVSTLPSIEQGKIIQSIKFANNGYSLFVNFEGTLAIYDLRKSIVSASWELNSESEKLISIDDSTTLCFTGDNLSRYLKKSKTWKDSILKTVTTKDKYAIDSTITNGGNEIICAYSDGTIVKYTLTK